jgi:hydroxymethylpyrimidine kinase/phosphomethylpyrimidine kinase
MKINNSRTLKPILLVSASDSSGAAGMQVDLRVVDDLGHPARCALTAVTVQGDGGLAGILPVDPDIVAGSVRSAILDPPGIASVKIGLITEAVVARSVSESLLPLQGKGVPVVLDPVMKSTPGSHLASDGAKKALFGDLLPMTTVVTPNRDELRELAVVAGGGAGDEEEMAGTVILAGAGCVLVTGGDDGGRTCLDVLYRGGSDPVVFEHPKIGERTTRGTGCAFSSALSVFLGRGLPLEAAVDSAIEYVTDRIRRGAVVGNWRLLFPGETRS